MKLSPAALGLSMALACVGAATIFVVASIYARGETRPALTITATDGRSGLTIAAG